MESRGRPATAADVAAHAGLSRTTVSHVLNGREARFPQATRDKVHASAAALDYRPSPAGRILATGRGDTIVFLMPDTTMESNIQEAVEWVARATAHIGSNVVLRFANQDPEVSVAAILKLRPLAVVDLGSLPASSRARLAGHGVPTVPSLDAPTRRGTPDPDEVIADLQVGALFDGGKTRILYAGLADGRQDAFGPRRFAAIARACAARGLEEPVHVSIPLESDAAGETLERYWQDGPIGVAAYNDSTAIAVLSAAADRGLSVPDRVAVVGNDGSAIGRLWRPRLTSIRVDIRGIIGEAIDELMAALDLPLSPLHSDARTRIELVPGESS